jgi:hypothetical protein
MEIVNGEATQVGFEKARERVKHTVPPSAEMTTHAGSTR